MTKSDINKLIAASRNSGYNETNKTTFRRLSRTLLHQVADLLGHELGAVNLRWNEGGIAVSGEMTLHTDLVYIQVSGIDLGILVRTCKGRRDYTGGHNTWFSWSSLQEHGARGLAAYATQLVAREQDRVTREEKLKAQS